MFPPQQLEDQQAGQWRDGLGYKIEEFDLRDNLMLEGGIYQAEGYFICQDNAAVIDPDTVNAGTTNMGQGIVDLEDLTAFEQVLKRLADEMLTD